MKRWLTISISLAALVATAVWVAATSDPQPVQAAFAEVSWQTNAILFALFVLASLLASVRLWFIARDIRSPISANDAVAAMTLGTLAGAVFFQIVGQTVARSTLLARRGTPVAATLAMTGYERIVALLVSLLFGVLGACYLFGRVSFDLQHGGSELLKLAVVAGLTVLAGAYFAWGKLVADWLRPNLRATHVGKVTRSLALSIAIQLCTLAAYLVAALAMAPQLHLVDVAAASAVVMLVTAVPISFAGWGIREFSAVLALGAIGMPAEGALVVAIQIGILSLAALMLLSAASLFRNSLRQKAQRQQSAAAIRRPNFEMLLAWCVPLAVATLVFFQVYIPTAQGTKLNVNLADPMAIVAGALCMLAAARTRSWPNWSIAGLNRNLLFATLAITVALAIGWTSFGWTAWAFTSKFVGWFILMAYGLTGALIVSKGGEAGREALFLTFVAAGTAVGAVEILIALLHSFGVASLSAPRASGVAANPNAFALQMAIVACVTLTTVRSDRHATAILAVALSAMWLSASRAGAGAIVVTLAAAIILLPSRRHVIGIAVVASAALALLVEAIYFAPAWLGVALLDPSQAGHFSPLVAMSYSPSWERQQTIEGGLALFQAFPLFGAGLGAFAESWRLVHGQVQVIHSTPLWLLAEFGIVGAAVMILPLARIMLHSLAGALAARPMAVLALLTCLAFSVMASVHEILYQRPLWLVLGAALTLGLRFPHPQEK